jgi:hypothetical protein
MLLTPDVILALLPIAVAATIALRVVIGIRTAGTFTSALLALTLLELGPRQSAALLLVTGGVGLAAAAGVARLALDRSARLGLVVVAVCAALVPTGVGSSSGGVPVVILAIFAERAWIEATADTPRAAGVLVANTVAAACGLAALLSRLSPVLLGHHWVISALIGTVTTAAVGSYRGLRMSELRRFRSLLAAAHIQGGR